MAIATPVLVNGTWFNTANLSVYNTNAGTNTYTVSLVAGRRYYMAIESSSSGAAEAISSVVHDPTGTPLSFTLCTDGTDTARITGYGSNAGNTLEVWEVNVTSTTATALIRITYAGAQTACGAGLFYISGEDDTNTSVQVVLATGTGTLPQASMATFGATDNLALLVVATESPTNTINVTESRTKLYENNETERNNHAVFYQNPHGGDVSLNASITSDGWAAIGFEIRAAGTGPVDVPVSDTFTVTDTRTGQTVAWNLAETATLTETGVALAPVTQTDAVALSDALTALTGPSTAVDSAALSESLTVLAADLVGTDNGALTETIVLHADVTAADSLALLDSATASEQGSSPSEVSGDELFTLTEAVTALPVLLSPTAEAGTLSDAMAVRVDIVASDSLAITDTVGTVPVDVAVLDAGTMTDVLNWSVAWSLTDTLTFTDTASASVPGVFEGEATMGAADLAPRLVGGP